MLHSSVNSLATPEAKPSSTHLHFSAVLKTRVNQTQTASKKKRRKFVNRPITLGGTGEERGGVAERQTGRDETVKKKTNKKRKKLISGCIVLRRALLLSPSSGPEQQPR